MYVLAKLGPMNNNLAPRGRYDAVVPRRDAWPISATEWAPLPLSMSAEHQRLERKHQCLQPEDQRVHEAEGVDCMKHYGAERACVLRDDDVMIVGIGIGDAAAARCYAVKAAFEERLEKDQERAGSCHLLSLDQLLSAPELARGDIILDVGDNHRNDGEWL